VPSHPAMCAGQGRPARRRPAPQRQARGTGPRSEPEPASGARQV